MEHWKHGHVFEDGGNRRLGRRTSPAGLVVSLTNGIADTSLMDEYQPHDEWPIRDHQYWKEGGEGEGAMIHEKEGSTSLSSLRIPELVPPCARISLKTNFLRKALRKDYVIYKHESAIISYLIFS